MRQAELRYARAVTPWHVFVAGFAGMLCASVIAWWLLKRPALLEAPPSTEKAMWCESTGDAQCFSGDNIGGTLCDTSARTYQSGCVLLRYVVCNTHRQDVNVCFATWRGCQSNAAVNGRICAAYFDGVRQQKER